MIVSGPTTFCAFSNVCIARRELNTSQIGKFASPKGASFIILSLSLDRDSITLSGMLEMFLCLLLVSCHSFLFVSHYSISRLRMITTSESQPMTLLQSTSSLLSTCHDMLQLQTAPCSGSISHHGPPLESWISSH